MIAMSRITNDHCFFPQEKEGCGELPIVIEPGQAGQGGEQDYLQAQPCEQNQQVLNISLIPTSSGREETLSQGPLCESGEQEVQQRRWKSFQSQEGKGSQVTQFTELKPAEKCLYPNSNKNCDIIRGV